MEREEPADGWLVCSLGHDHGAELSSADAMKFLQEDVKLFSGLMLICVVLIVNISQDFGNFKQT